MTVFSLEKDMEILTMNEMAHLALCVVCLSHKVDTGS